MIQKWQGDKSITPHANQGQVCMNQTKKKINKTKIAPLLHKVVFKKLTRDGASETSLLEPVKP